MATTNERKKCKMKNIDMQRNQSANRIKLVKFVHFENVLCANNYLKCTNFLIFAKRHLDFDSINLQNLSLSLSHLNEVNKNMNLKKRRMKNCIR